MKRPTIHAVNLMFALLIFAGSSSAQVAIGVQAFNSYGGGPFDVVNLGNLDVNFTIPVLYKAGRGMPFTYDLSFDNSIWTPVNSGGTTSWQPPTSGFGWNGLGEFQAGKLTYGTYQFTAPCNPPSNMTNVTVTVYSNWIYTDPSGAAHPLGGGTTQNTGGTCPQREFSTATGASGDGSGYTLNVTNFNNGVLYSRAGKTLNLPINLPSGGASTVTDANGNQIVANSSGTFVDTLGQTALTAAGGGASPLTFTYTAPSGGAAAVTVTYATYTVKTNFGCSGVAEYNQSGVTLVDRVTFPNGTYYQFSYEPTPGGTSGQVTGRLAQITLPTGATIAYAYNYQSGHHNGIICSDGSTDLSTRTLNPGGVWIYARTQVAGSHWQTKVTTPPDPQNSGNASDDTVVDFQGAYSFYETQRQTYQGSSSSGTLLLTTSTCWNGNASNCTTTAVSAPITQCTIAIQYPGVNGQQAKTATSYNSAGLVSEVDQYSYGAGAPGGLIRKIVTQYAFLGIGSPVFDHPSSVLVEDSGSNVKASTTYSYDQTTPTTTIGTLNHIAVSVGRGNLTTLATQVSGSVTLYKKFTYYDTGNINTATDTGTTSSGGPNTTTYNYADATSTCSNTFPTGISEPLSLSQSFTWDCTGGVMKTATDENSKVSTVYYTGSNFGKTADANFWRPYATTDQLSNPTTLSYPSATTAESTMLFNTLHSVVDKRVKVDGFGRPIVNQTMQGPSPSNYDSVETDYDFAGRPSKRTMPYSAAADSTCSGTCLGISTTYDALDRPWTVTDGGTGKTTYTYSQNDIYQEVTPPPPGESSKKKQLEYDSLGRLTSVCEITGSTGSGTCGQTGNQTGFWTKYSYDLLGDMTGVTQNAQAVSASQETRTYTFDMLGRLTSELNPETGSAAITYVYDSWDASCGTYTSASDLVEKKDAMGNVTCFKYDGRHRVTQITYPSGTYASATPTKCFVYDSATVNSNVMTNAATRLAESYTTSATSCPGTKTVDEGFSYSVRGELQDVWENTPHSGGWYHVNASYWANGNLDVLNGGTSPLPGLPAITYGASDGSGIDGEGRITKVNTASGQNLVTSVGYNVSSQVTGVTFGSLDNDAYQYDPNTGRMTQYKFNMGTGPQSQTGALNWNANGTLQQLQITDQINTANSQTCNFWYDDLGRLAGQDPVSHQTANCGTLWQQAFSLDGFGNLKKTGSASFSPTYTGESGTNTSPLNQYYQISGGNPGASNYYDANGNLKNDVTHAYTWDADGNMLSVDTVTMMYDAQDRMVEQTRGSSHTEIAYGPYGMKLALMNGQQLVNAFVKLPGGARAVYNTSGLAYYRHADHLGSSRLATTPSRTKYYDVAYAPYGEEYDGSGTQDLAFTDQNQDTAGGGWSGNLYDFMMREYRTAHGRWTSPDPAGLSVVDPSNPQSWNRYAYVNNNPLRLIDPTGLGSIDPSADNCWYRVDASYARTTFLYPNGAIYIESWLIYAHVTTVTCHQGIVGGGTASSAGGKNPNPKPQPPKPCKASVGQRITSGVVGVLNIGIGEAKTFVSGAVGAVGVIGAPETFGGSLLLLGVAGYGVMTSQAQVTSGVGQLVTALTGDSEAGGGIQQVGDIMSGPIAGITTLAITGDPEKAATAANLESSLLLGDGLINSAGRELVQKAVDGGLTAAGNHIPGCQ